MRAEPDFDVNAQNVPPANHCTAGGENREANVPRRPRRRCARPGSPTGGVPLGPGVPPGDGPTPRRAVPQRLPVVVASHRRAGRIAPS